MEERAQKMISWTSHQQVDSTLDYDFFTENMNDEHSILPHELDCYLGSEMFGSDYAEEDSIDQLLALEYKNQLLIGITNVNV